MQHKNLQNLKLCSLCYPFFPPISGVSAANMFLLISSILGSKTAGPHTQFVQSFMEECVECLEQGTRGSILQFMPFTVVRVR